MELEQIKEHIKILQEQMYYVSGNPNPVYEFNRILIRMEYLMRLKTMIEMNSIEIHTEDV